LAKRVERRLSVDQARLRPHLRPVEEQARVFRAEVDRASEAGIDTTAPRWKVPVGDDLQRLRGLPAVGRGVRGVIGGTDPEREAIRRDERRR
jgi:hypothetical protein